MKFFEIDKCYNFWNKNIIHVFGKLYKCYTPFKNKPYTYFWIKHEKKDKKFYRITNNFFIEI